MASTWLEQYKGVLLLLLKESNKTVWGPSQEGKLGLREALCSSTRAVSTLGQSIAFICFVPLSTLCLQS